MPSENEEKIVEFVSQERNALVSHLRSRAEELPDFRDDMGMCVPLAHLVVDELTRRGVPAIVQAGSMQWPLMDLGADDGVQGTHFSYMWSPKSPTFQLAQLVGVMPEIHVWAARMDTKELIDLGTRRFPDLCRNMGVDWSGPTPPDYLWSAELPEGVRYIPDESATGYAMAMIWTHFEPHYLQAHRELMERLVKRWRLNGKEKSQTQDG